METIFPTNVGYRAAFAVSFRKLPQPPGTTERVGTVILKRTYDIDPDTESLSPSADAFDVFFADDPTIPPFRYESDMVPFKPRSDVIVLEFAGDPGQDALQVNGVTWLEHDLPRTDSPADLFGWAPRNDDPRSINAGDFSKDENDYPPVWPLPDSDDMEDRAPLPEDFSNLFYNGYSRDAATGNIGYLPADATIVIDRPEASEVYQFDLSGDTASATLFYAIDDQPDIEECWEAIGIAMPLDTLVIEPEQDRCYAVWRGVWNFDEPSSDRYRRLIVTASA